MDLDFELGSPDRARGHAIAYFRLSEDPNRIFATYLVVPPVTMNLAKYVPPMFATQFAASDLQSISAVPLPPVPEEVENEGWLRRLAEARGDDLLALGATNEGDMERMLLSTAEAAQRYQRLYQDAVSRLPLDQPPEPAPVGELDSDSILYQLLDERSLLSEIAKLAGTLRYAVDGNDDRLRKETMAKLQAATKNLPEKYRGEQIIAAAQESGDRGSRLTQLYLDRGFKLAAEDYEALGPIEQQIKTVEGQ